MGEAACRLRCDAIVAVMQASDFRSRHNASGRCRLDGPSHRAVLRERPPSVDYMELMAQRQNLELQGSPSAE